MSDQIFIKGLSLHAYHGVMPYEGKVGQTFTIDIELDIDLADAARSDKVADTVSYDKVVDLRERGLQRAEIPADRGRRRSRGRRGARRLSARADDHGDDPQAACADRRHLQRCRRHPRASAAANPDHDGGPARARRQCRRQPRPFSTARSRLLCDGTEVRLTARSVRLPHAALGLQIPAALHQPVHRGRDHARAARPAGACAGGRTRARPRPRARKALGSAHRRYRHHRLWRPLARRTEPDTAASARCSSALSCCCRLPRSRPTW